MKKRIYKTILVSAFFSICLVGNAQSQQGSTAPPDSQEKDKDATPQQKADAAPTDTTQPPAPAGLGLGTNSNSMQILQMNGAAPLPTGRVSSLQFGPIYLQSTDFFQALETINASNQPNTLFQSVSIFRADLVFDQAWRNSRFAVQYEPRLMITNGVVQLSTSNLNADWTSVFAISPRLSIGLKNNFGYFDQQAQFDGLNLQGDLTTGTLVQAQFLDGPGHFLNDRSELDVRYLLSPRNRIDVTPFFEYYNASGAQNLTVTESKSPGVELGFSRLLSPTRTIGFGYTVIDTFFGNALPTTLYQTVDMTYAQQVSATWRFAGTAGATRATTAVGPPQTTATGTFNLIKLFKDSKLAFEYTRGNTIGFQVTNGFAELYDVSYQRQLTPRVRFMVGSGYYRQFLAATNASGIFVAPGLTYQIANRWFLETLYTFKNQANGGANFETGSLNYASVGIRWEPGVRPAAIN
jgi:hypothetical protein